MTSFIRSLFALLLCLFSLSMFSGCEVEVDEGPIEDTVEELSE